MTLICGINDIKLPNLIAEEGFEKKDGLLAFDGSGKGLFLSFEDVDQCRRKYLQFINHQKTFKVRETSRDHSEELTFKPALCE